MRQSSAGFTLVEMMIAVAIATMLVGGIYAALVSTQRTAESQAVDAGKDAARMRAVELLKCDLRARLKLKVEVGPEEISVLTLQTTTDSLSLGEMKRTVEGLRYTASPRGLKRVEGKDPEIELATGPVAFEFWENGDWRKQTGADPAAIRVTFSNPAEQVVIR